MNIQKFNIEDYDKVFALWKDTAGVGLRSLDDSREGIDRFLKRNPDTNFIASDDAKNDEIIGAILCGHDGRRGYIYHLAVKDTMRKNGVGRALVDEVVKALKLEGINKVALLAFKDNKAGNGFWESLGFGQRDDLTYRDKSLEEGNF